MINWLGRYIASVGINGLKEKEKDVGNIIWRGLASGIREGVHNNILAPLGLDKVASMLSSGVSSIQNYLEQYPELKKYSQVAMMGLGAYYITNKLQNMMQPPKPKTAIEKVMGSITNAIMPSFSSKLLLPLVGIAGAVILKNNLLPKDILQKAQDYGLGNIMGNMPNMGMENSFSGDLQSLLPQFLNNHEYGDIHNDYMPEVPSPKSSVDRGLDAMKANRMKQLFGDPLSKIRGDN